MRNALGIGILLAALLASPALPQAAQTPEAIMGAALHQERVTGNLKAAIDGYLRVLAAKGVSRTLAAQAQYHIGVCYEQLGNLEARKAFESVVRNYADQKNLVAQARTRLAAMGGGSASVRARLVWDNALDDWGSASADGRYVSFIDWNESRVDIRNLVTGENLRIFDKGGPAKDKGEPGGSALSADGKRVAFAYMRFDRPRTQWEYDELHVMSADGSGHKVLIAGAGLEYIEPYSWSPDGKWIACGVSYPGGPDGRQSPIALVSAQDGQIRWIRKESKEFNRGILFSPDGKWLAFSSGPRVGARSLFVTTADESAALETKIAEDAHVMGWTPDGSGILFSRSRLGVHHLYLQPVHQGRSAGDAQPLYTASDVGAHPMGVTANGALLFGLDNRRADGAIFELSNGMPRTGSSSSLFPVSDEVNLLLAGGVVQYSPDGKRLLAVTPARSILIREVATGADRVIVPQVKGWFRVDWAGDSESLVMLAETAGGKLNAFRVSAADGSMTLLAELGERRWSLALSPDGKTLYRGQPQAVYARDLRTGSEKQIWDKGVAGPFQLKLSRDGSKLGIRCGKYLGVVDLATGAVGDLQTDSKTSDAGYRFWAMDWSSDQKHILAIAKIGAGIDRMELWTFPAEGGEPVKQPIPKGFRGLSLSPDGKHLATTVLTRRSQVWALENFLPGRK